ncbi:GNAT family N-acetyltransferase [Spirulina sp. CS-785/01]|uniref:GNAT family N-acetyltransferase n=1 Tax=Spirulina sp. CS-785/01 TaxID=3021716 RepID=UPI00232DA898|nr:GNAT family N-acetyltransferase [Spirulina sp. CS-785/01]MDB9312445.1 GNAT family N-acetyltransferase [Spirulina sp. CS-785/01]
MDSCYGSGNVNLSASAAVPATGFSGHPLTSSARKAMRIRMACFGDLHSLAELLANSFHPPVGLMMLAYPFLRLGIYEDLRTRFLANSPHHVCLTAIAPPVSPLSSTGEEIAGIVELALRSPTLPEMETVQSPYISNLAVSPTHRRQGIGRQLLLSCEPVAQEWGFQEIYLHVLENNEKAKQLYRSLGYETEKVENTCANFLFKQPRRLLLRKRLG